MAGKKRTANGQIKPETHPQDTAMPDATPPCAQPQPPSGETASTPSTTPARRAKPAKPQRAAQKAHSPRQKLAKLPPNTSLTKRPLVHPALPSPFSSPSHPKTLYITASSPFIPALKRVRKLLAHMARREKQSAAARAGGNGAGKGYAEASGWLDARAVEREIVDGVGRTGGGGGKGGRGEEEVLVKATGRAIPRALEIGCVFQGEGDCWVRVDMGSVVAIDDVEVKSGSGGGEEEEVPETRLRTLSSVTVRIGLR